MTDTKMCPYCGEDIKIEAIKCKHCQSVISKEDDQLVGATAPVKPQHAVPKIKKPIWQQWWVWAAALVVLFIVLIVSLADSGTLTPSTDSQLQSPSVKDGFNASANISNRGMAAMKDGWFYYESNKALHKMRIDGSNLIKLNNEYSGYFNVVGNWIFYINYDEDIKSYRIRADGSERQAVN